MGLPSWGSLEDAATFKTTTLDIPLGFWQFSAAIFFRLASLSEYVEGKSASRSTSGLETSAFSSFVMTREFNWAASVISSWDVASKDRFLAIIEYEES